MTRPGAPPHSQTCLSSSRARERRKPATYALCAARQKGRTGIAAPTPLWSSHRLITQTASGHSQRSRQKSKVIIRFPRGRATNQLSFNGVRLLHSPMRRAKKWMGRPVPN